MKSPIFSPLHVCMVCGKMPEMAFNRPHSQHKTKRVVRPNIGMWQGLQVCAQCRKTLAKPDRVKLVRPAQPAVEAQA